jgi:hypothetical protein
MLTVPGTFGRTVPASSTDPVAVMAIMSAVCGVDTGFHGDVPLTAMVELAKQAHPVGAVV